MPTLTQRIALATLVAPGASCPRCQCGTYLTPRQARRDGVCQSCANAPAFSAIRKEDGTPALSRCGCIAGSCFCGLYPTDAEWSAMQAEAEADLPEREPLTDAEANEAEELRNFFGRRCDA